MSNPEISIRLAQPEDLPEIQKIFRESISAICQKDYSQEQLEAWSSKNNGWGKKIKTEYFLVAASKSKILGFASLDGKDYLDYMYVHKDFQHQGIAKKLYAEIEKEAIKRGGKVLKSDVSITAKPFFEQMGLKIISSQVNLVKGVEIVNFKMEKPIAEKCG